MFGTQKLANIRHVHFCNFLQVAQCYRSLERENPRKYWENV